MDSPACLGGIRGGSPAATVADELRSVEAHLNLLAANGAQVMVYGEVADSIQGRPEALSRRPRFTSDAEWSAYGERITALARHTLARGVRLAYHHHMGAYVETAEDVDHLLRSPVRKSDCCTIRAMSPSPAAMRRPS